MATPNEIVVRIITDLAALKSGMQQATGIIGNAASAAQGLSSKLGDIEQGARRAGMQLALIGGAGAAAFGVATKSFLEYDDAVNKAGILTGMTKEGIAGINQQLLVMATQVNQSPKALADGFFLAKSMVGDTTKAMDILRQASYFVAEGGDLNTAVTALAGVTNGYANANMTAAHAADVLKAGIKSGITDIDGFMSVMGKANVVSDAYGVSFEEITANVATLMSQGLPATTAIQAITMSLFKLEHPSKAAEKALAGLGLTAEDVKKSIADKGLLATMQDLWDLSGHNLDVIEELVPGNRALVEIFGTVVNQADKYRSALYETHHALNLNMDEFRRMQAEDPGFAFRQLKNDLSVLSITVGSFVAPVLDHFVQADLIPFITWAQKMTLLHPELTKFLVLFGAIGSAVAAVAGGFLLFVSVAAGGLKAIIDISLMGGKAAGALWNMAAAMARLAIDAGAAALSMAKTAWDTLATNIGKAADNIWNFVRGMAQAALSPDVKTKVQLDTAYSTGQVKPAYSAGVSAFEKLGLGAIQGLGISLGPALKAAIPTILAGLAGAMAALAAGIATLLEAALSIALTLAPIIAIVAAVLLAAFLIYHYREQIWSGLTTLFDILKEFFTEAVPKWFRENFTPEKIGYALGFAAGVLLVAMFPIPFLIIKFRSQIEGFLSAIPGFVAGIPGRIAAFVGDHWYAILFAMFPIEMAIVRWRGLIEGFLTGVATFVAGIPDRIADFVGDHWRGILFALFPIPMAIINWRSNIEQWLSDIADFVASIPGKIGAFIGDHWKDFISGFGFPQWTLEFTTKASSWVADMVPKIPGLFGALGTAIANGIKDAFLSLIDFGAWLKAGFATFWNHVPGPVKSFLQGVGGGFGDVIGFFTKGEMGLRNFLGGMALVGEAGPELLRLPRGTDVIRNADMGQSVRDAGGAGGGGGLSIAMSIAANFVNYDEFKRCILDEVAAKLDENAGKVRLAAPRLGTFGAGMSRP